MTKNTDFQVPPNRPIGERVGLLVDAMNAADATKIIAAAEAAGVRQTWMGQRPSWPDALTTLAAAATKNI